MAHSMGFRTSLLSSMQVPSPTTGIVSPVLRRWQKNFDRWTSLGTIACSLICQAPAVTLLEVLTLFFNRQIVCLLWCKFKISFSKCKIACGCLSCKTVLGLIAPCRVISSTILRTYWFNEWYVMQEMSLKYSSGCSPFSDIQWKNTRSKAHTEPKCRNDIPNWTHPLSSSGFSRQLANRKTVQLEWLAYWWLKPQQDSGCYSIWYTIVWCFGSVCIVSTIFE